MKGIYLKGSSRLIKQVKVWVSSRALKEKRRGMFSFMQSYSQNTIYWRRSLLNPQSHRQRRILRGVQSLWFWVKQICRLQDSQIRQSVEWTSKDDLHEIRCLRNWDTLRPKSSQDCSALQHNWDWSKLFLHSFRVMQWSRSVIVLSRETGSARERGLIDCLLNLVWLEIPWRAKVKDHSFWLKASEYSLSWGGDSNNRLWTLQISWRE